MNRKERRAKERAEVEARLVVKKEVWLPGVEELKLVAMWQAKQARRSGKEVRV